MIKPVILAVILPTFTACTTGTNTSPINVCVLAQCEQQADTGGGDLSEGSQDAQVDVGL